MFCQEAYRLSCGLEEEGDDGAHHSWQNLPQFLTKFFHPFPTPFATFVRPALRFETMTPMTVPTAANTPKTVRPYFLKIYLTLSLRDMREKSSSFRSPSLSFSASSLSICRWISPSGSSSNCCLSLSISALFSRILFWFFDLSSSRSLFTLFISSSSLFLSPGEVDFSNWSLSLFTTFPFSVMVLLSFLFCLSNSLTRSSCSLIALRDWLSCCSVSTFCSIMWSFRSRSSSFVSPKYWRMVCGSLIRFEQWPSTQCWRLDNRGTEPAQNQPVLKRFEMCRMVRMVGFAPLLVVFRPALVLLP